MQKGSCFWHCLETRWVKIAPRPIGRPGITYPPVNTYKQRSPSSVWFWKGCHVWGGILRSHLFPFSVSLRNFPFLLWLEQYSLNPALFSCLCSGLFLSISLWGSQGPTAALKIVSANIYLLLCSYGKRLGNCSVEEDMSYPGSETPILQKRKKKLWTGSLLNCFLDPCKSYFARDDIPN